MTKLILCLEDGSIYTSDDTRPPLALAAVINSGQWDDARQGELPELQSGPEARLLAVAYRNLVIVTLRGETPVRLSRQETQVLLGLNKGHSTKQIAYQMGIESCTVRTYVSTIKNKLGVNTRESILPRAIQLGLLEPPMFEKG
jgi:DNA-binding NarL/FixJ family response regulator